MDESSADWPWTTHSSTVKCASCSGEGRYEEYRMASHPRGSWNTPYHEVACAQCEGRGRLDVERCDRCGKVDADSRPRLEHGEWPDGITCDCDEDTMVAWHAAGQPLQTEEIVDGICRRAKQKRYAWRPVTIHDVKVQLRFAKWDLDQAKGDHPLEHRLADELDTILRSMDGLS